MKENYFIDFVLKASIEGMHFEPHNEEGFVFKPDEADSLRFLLKPTEPSEDSCGHRLGLTCEVFKSYPATKDQFIFVKKYNSERVMLRVADRFSLPYKPKDEILISENGTIKEGYSPRRYLCPADIGNLIESAESDLTIYLRRFINMIRWRQKCDSYGDPIKRRSLFWRTDDGDYPLAPLEGEPFKQFIVNGMVGIHWSERHISELQSLWSSKDISEPLGHTLLREAIALSSDSPRSSILMIVTAIETAVKMHISKIAPDTAWLIEKIQSPPIFKVLREYIPKIHHNYGRELDFWDKLKPYINKLRELIEVRNKIAHTGIIPESTEPIKNYIELAYNLLYLIDVLEGHDWAKSLVDNKLRKELGWPGPMDMRIVIKISGGY